MRVPSFFCLKPCDTVSSCPHSEDEARVTASGVLRVNKTIFYTGLTGVANRVEDLLRLNRLPFVRMDSSMLPRQRSEAVRTFNHDLQVGEAVGFRVFIVRIPAITVRIRWQHGAAIALEVVNAIFHDRLWHSPTL